MKSLLATGSLAAVLFLVSCDKNNDNNNNNENTSAQDKSFVNDITLSNRSEISLANLALAKATDTSVRNYAQMMIMDHTQAESNLRSITDSLKLTLPTDSLNAMADSLRPVLQGLSGVRFDSAYIASQVPAHQKAITTVQTEVNSGTNSALMNYASSILPKIQMHLTKADSIAAKFR